MDCFTSLNVESLQLCTEGLGFESSDEVEESKDERRDDWRNHEKADAIKHSLMNQDRNLRNCTDVNGTSSGFKRSKVVSNFPPPISSIGSRGRPCFIFRAYRHDGRFVLREIKIPNNEILHASRENGRLTLHLVPSIEEMTEEKEDANHEEEEEEAAAEEEEEEDMKSAGIPEICDG
ncbi:hypothetical protein AAC387_Pa01g0835 [Persea americana]